MIRRSDHDHRSGQGAVRECCRQGGSRGPCMAETAARPDELADRSVLVGSHPSAGICREAPASVDSRPAGVAGWQPHCPLHCNEQWAPGTRSAHPTATAIARPGTHTEGQGWGAGCQLRAIPGDFVCLVARGRVSAAHEERWAIQPGPWWTTAGSDAPPTAHDSPQRAARYSGRSRFRPSWAGPFRLLPDLRSGDDQCRTAPLSIVESFQPDLHQSVRTHGRRSPSGARRLDRNCRCARPGNGPANGFRQVFPKQRPGPQASSRLLHAVWTGLNCCALDNRLHPGWRSSSDAGPVSMHQPN